MNNWIVRLIKQLADVLHDKNLTRVSIGWGFVTVSTEHDVGLQSRASQPSLHFPGEHEVAPRAEAEVEANVTSPIVGVVYLAPQPGAKHFVEVGQSVQNGDILLIIESMKVMNEIKTDRAGRIARIFVKDSDPVEYLAPLMLIE